MKVLMTRPMPRAVADRAKARFDVTIRDSNVTPSPAEMQTALRDYDIIVPTLGDQISSGDFAAAGDLRCGLLANFGAGINHIDVATARALGIEVTNTPGAVTDATADIAMALILMSARRAGEGERLLRAGKWQGWNPTQMLGLHVTGKTVGIVGMGRIGQAIARRCHFGFGMDVRYFSRSAKELDFPATRENSLTDLAASVDILVASLPGGAGTRHTFGAAVFEAMRPTGHFINIARGDVVDESALISALQSGKIAGAGLDVYEFEPKVPEALIAMQQVTLLPHLGTNGHEIRISMGHMALDNVAAFIAGEPLPNRV